MKSWFSDVRFAVRSLLRAPVFAATALLTLACGIGLTAGMFGVMYQALLAPLPYAHPEQLVALDFNYRNEKPSDSQVGTAADFLIRWSRSFESFGVADGGNTAVNLADPSAGRGHAFPVQRLRISHDFLATLRIPVRLGRSFTVEEETRGGPRAALLSDSLWRSAFSSDPAILGRVIRVDEEDVPIVGVLPSGATADLQGGTRERDPAGIFLPLQLSPADPGYEGNNYQMIARLRDGVSVGQAQQEAQALLPRFAQQNSWYAQWHAPNGELNQLRVFPLQTALAGNIRSSLLMLLGAAAVVLLVTFLNLAGLMVARTAARTRELAMRSALGASRGNLVRLLLAEALVLAVTGVVLGTVSAQIISHAFLSYVPVDLPHWSGPAPIWLLTACAGTLAAIGIVIFGLLPMSVVVRGQVNRTLQQAGSQGQSALYQRIGRALIVMQVSLAFILLMAASLLMHVFLVMRVTAPGIQTAEITIGQVSLKGEAYATTTRTDQLAERVVERLEHTPGVERAGATNGLPLDRGLNIGGWPVGRQDLRHSIEARFVSPSYMGVIGIPLLQGRGFSEGDSATAPKVAIVSQSTAKRWWPSGDAIGSRIDVGDESTYEIVGIARDTHERSLLDTPGLLVYVPLPQVSDRFTKMLNGWFPLTLVVRARTGVDVRTAMQDALSSSDPELPLAKLSTMQALVDQTIAAPRFFSSLSGSFAFFTLTLASMGLFGLLSYQVTQRTREIGIRMALGATRGDVLQSFVIRSVVLTSLGLAMGAVLSLGLPTLLSGSLAEFAAVHLGANGTRAEIEGGLLAAVLLLLVTALSGLPPALRASSIEPITALRTE